MNNKKSGFQVGLREREVNLTATQNGENFELKHILKYPTEKDWIDYERLSIETKGKGRKTTVRPQILAARIKLYDSLVIRVDGYVDAREKPPTELSISSPDWKSQIPAMHKSTVIDSFGEVSETEEDEGNEKN